MKHIGRSSRNLNTTNILPNCANSSIKANRKAFLEVKLERRDLRNVREEGSMSSEKMMADRLRSASNAARDSECRRRSSVKIALHLQRPLGKVVFHGWFRTIRPSKHSADLLIFQLGSLIDMSATTESFRFMSFIYNYLSVSTPLLWKPRFDCWSSSWL